MANNLFNQAQDALDFLTNDQADRAGQTCARIARSLTKGVDPEALAAQLTANARKVNPANPETVTVQDIHSAAKMFRLNKSRQVYSRTVAGELERLANEGSEFDPAPQF